MGEHGFSLQLHVAIKAHVSTVRKLRVAFSRPIRFARCHQDIMPGVGGTGPLCLIGLAVNLTDRLAKPATASLPVRLANEIRMQPSTT